MRKLDGNITFPSSTMESGGDSMWITKHIDDSRETCDVCQNEIHLKRENALEVWFESAKTCSVVLKRLKWWRKRGEFPCVNLSVEIDEHLSKTLMSQEISLDLLRVVNAHLKLAFRQYKKLKSSCGAPNEAVSLKIARDLVEDMNTWIDGKLNVFETSFEKPLERGYSDVNTLDDVIWDVLIKKIPIKSWEGDTCDDILKRVEDDVAYDILIKNRENIIASVIGDYYIFKIFQYTGNPCGPVPPLIDEKKVCYWPIPNKESKVEKLSEATARKNTSFSSVVPNIICVEPPLQMKIVICYQCAYVIFATLLNPFAEDENDVSIDITKNVVLKLTYTQSPVKLIFRSNKF